MSGFAWTITRVRVWPIPHTSWTNEQINQWLFSERPADSRLNGWRQ